jgi:aminoglycoside phosphotransferase (APT) family kinase protein
MSKETGGFVRRIERWIEHCTGSPGVHITRAERLPGGASRETWVLDLDPAATPALPRKLILRCDPPGSSFSGQRRDEYSLLQVARACGVPVPRVFWLADSEEALGAPGFFMEWIEGETVPRRILRDPGFAAARSHLIGELARALVQIHSVDWQRQQLHFLPCPPPEQAASSFEIERFESLYRAIAPDPHPVFEWAFCWLREHAQLEPRRTLVHGDFRMGNVMVGRDGLRAVLDWELAHIGDPLEDLAWFCVRSWRFGNDHLAAGGLASREEFFAAYEAAGGAPVDARRVRYWEVLGNLKWGIITIFQAKGFLDGTTRDLERAAIGRRTAEAEWELVQLLESEL